MKTRIAVFFVLLTGACTQDFAQTVEDFERANLFQYDLDEFETAMNAEGFLLEKNPDWKPFYYDRLPWWATQRSTCFEHISFNLIRRVCAKGEMKIDAWVAMERDIAAKRSRAWTRTNKGKP